MPPKAKFTKEEIIGAGLAILHERDISAVTAREIGNYLGSSARPIFTVFDNMGEVLNGIEAKAREIYSEYVEQGLQQTPAFKGVGQSYIQFAINEPKLFQLLFMRKTSGNIGVNRILPEIDDNYTDILKSITDEYPVSADDAVILYRHLWIYSHGIATLCATSMCRFTEDEIGIMLTGKDLGGRHQSRLSAILRGNEHGGSGADRLSATHVTYKNTAHGDILRHVALNVGDHSLLRVGQVKGERGEQGRNIGVFASGCPCRFGHFL